MFHDPIDLHRPKPSTKGGNADRPCSHIGGLYYKPLVTQRIGVLAVGHLTMAFFCTLVAGIEAEDTVVPLVTKLGEARLSLQTSQPSFEDY